MQQMNLDISILNHFEYQRLQEKPKQRGKGTFKIVE